MGHERHIKQGYAPLRARLHLLPAQTLATLRERMIVMLARRVETRSLTFCATTYDERVIGKFAVVEQSHAFAVVLWRWAIDH